MTDPTADPVKPALTDATIDRLLADLIAHLSHPAPNSSDAARAKYAASRLALAEQQSARVEPDVTEGNENTCASRADSFSEWYFDALHFALNNLRAERDEKGLSFADIARVLETAPQVVDRTFRGEHTPSLRTLSNIARAMNCRIEVNTVRLDRLSPPVEPPRADWIPEARKRARKVSERHRFGDGSYDLSDEALNQILDAFKAE